MGSGYRKYPKKDEIFIGAWDLSPEGREKVS